MDKIIGLLPLTVYLIGSVEFALFIEGATGGFSYFFCPPSFEYA